MLVVMLTDSIISAKGFKAQYSRACGARIIVEDHGFLTYLDSHNDNVNCTWTLIAANPGKHKLRSVFDFLVFVFLIAKNHTFH